MSASSRRSSHLRLLCQAHFYSRVLAPTVPAQPLVLCYRVCLLLSTYRSISKLPDSIGQAAQGHQFCTSTCSPQPGAEARAGSRCCKLMCHACRVLVGAHREKARAIGERVDALIHEDSILAKVDVEGFEPSAFESMKGMFDSHRWGATPQVFVQACTARLRRSDSWVALQAASCTTSGHVRFARVCNASGKGAKHTQLS